jgi:hypothetical protein
MNNKGENEQFGGGDIINVVRIYAIYNLQPYLGSRTSIRQEYPFYQFSSSSSAPILWALVPFTVPEKFIHCANPTPMCIISDTHIASFVRLEKRSILNLVHLIGQVCPGIDIHSVNISLNSRECRRTRHELDSKWVRNMLDGKTCNGGKRHDVRVVKF